MNEEDIKKLIFKIEKAFKNKVIKKIFWNDDLKKAIVLAPSNDMDGIYIYEEGKKPIPFVPSEDFKLFDKIVQEQNLIYDHNELDDLIHTALSQYKCSNFLI